MKSDETQGRGATALVEEAFSILKGTPASVFAIYYAGALPFVVALLYFWADMAHDAYALQRLFPWSIVLTVLFVWMKTCQSIFAVRVRARLSPRDDEGPLSIRRVLAIALTQAILQPLGFIVLPTALFFVAPFGWAYAFFQNVTVLDDGTENSATELARRANSLAKLWQTQNHLVIWLISPILVQCAAVLFLVLLPIMELTTPEWSQVLLGLYSTILLFLLFPLSPFGVIVALNISSLFLLLPFLLNTLLGIQTSFVMSFGAMLNPTFMAIVCGLTYLCMDPVLKTAYVLRCYYGQTLETGEDLRVRLRRFRPPSTAALILVASVLLSLGAGPVHAQEPRPAVPEGLAAQLDEALGDVLEKRRYAWRMPRVETEQEGFLADFSKAVGETLQAAWSATIKWVGTIIEWVLDKLGFGDDPARRPLSASGAVVRATLLILIAALAVAALMLAYQRWRGPRPLRAESLPLTTAPPDLTDESTSADELPEDGWLTLGRSLAERGERRLAMRAFFLGGLASLADQRMVRIAKHKSNRDYARELSRQGGRSPAIVPTFLEGVTQFEAVWYGYHVIGGEQLDDFARNLRGLRQRDH